MCLSLHQTDNFSMSVSSGKIHFWIVLTPLCISHPGATTLTSQTSPSASARSGLSRDAQSLEIIEGLNCSSCPQGWEVVTTWGTVRNHLSLHRYLWHGLTYTKLSLSDKNVVTVYLPVLLFSSPKVFGDQRSPACPCWRNWVQQMLVSPCIIQ